jgi:hypothetical protein
VEVFDPASTRVTISLSLKHLNSLQLLFTYELPVTVSYPELLCSADGLQDNPSTRTPRKTVALLLRCVRTISKQRSWHRPTENKAHDS